MFRKPAILAALMAILATGNLYAAQINSTWIGTEITFWETADNWNPAVVPDNDADTFAVTIDSRPDKADILLSAHHTIDQLDCYGEVNLNKYTWEWVQLTILNGLTNHGDLHIDHFDIAGDVNNLSGASIELSEHLNIYGNLYNQSDASIDVFPHDIDVEDGEVYNNGVVRCFGGGAIGETPYFRNNGHIQLYNGGSVSGEIFDNNSTGVITGHGQVGGYSSLNNRGTISSYLGPLLLHCDGEYLTNTGTLRNNPGTSLNAHSAIKDVNNNGTIEVNGGGAVAFDCNLTNKPNSIIKLLGGTLTATTITQKADANFVGFGGITGNLQIDPNALVKLTGPTNIIGDVNIAENATLEISDGQTLITGHTVCDGTIHLIGGTVIFQGGCDCDDCTIINEAGTDRNHFDINTDGIENLKDFAEFADDWLWQATWY